MRLRGGNETEDRRLDRIFQLDWNSLNYPVKLATHQQVPRSYTWSVGQNLDQGQEGACVGFGWSHEFIARPKRAKNITDDTARALYRRAQQLDEWAGEEYEGTSVLAGAKAAKEAGNIGGYTWALTVEDAILSLGYKGPVVFGFDWWSGMFTPDGDGFIRATGYVAGGHCICAYGIKIVWLSKPKDRPWFLGDLDLDNSYIKLWNSWGPDWGHGGTCKLPLRDFVDRLFVPNSVDACVPNLRR